MDSSPSNTEVAALIDRAVALHQQGKLSEALAVCEQALSAAPNSVDARYGRGKIFYALKDYARALASYDEALHLDPGNAAVHNDRGIVLKELRRYDDALRSCDRAIGLRPDYAEAYCNRGNALGSLGRYEEALASYDRALALKPDDAEAHYKRGLALQTLKRYEAALASYDRALALRPDYADAYSNRGVVLALLKKSEEGVASLQQAVRIDPRHVYARLNLGLALVAQGKVEEGLASYLEALRSNPDVALVHHDLGMAYMHLGRLEEAKASFYQALKLKPDAETYLYLHSLLLDPRDLSPAIACLEAAVSLQPGNMDYEVFLGMLLDYAGRAEDAGVYLRRAQHGSGLNKARLDAWNYLRSASEKMPTMVGSKHEGFRLGMKAAPPSGLVLEFGVRFGVSIRQIAGLVEQQVHGFDSFEGLPETWHHEPKGMYTTAGVMPKVPDNVVLHKGWFENTLPEFVKSHEGNVRFMNIDCDIYSSTRTILDFLSSRVAPGTVIVFDEYIGNERWRQDEFKAFQEAVSAYGWRYEYLAFSLLTKQAVVRILQ